MVLTWTLQVLLVSTVRLGHGRLLEPLQVLHAQHVTLAPFRGPAHPLVLPALLGHGRQLVLAYVPTVMLAPILPLWQPQLRRSA